MKTKNLIQFVPIIGLIFIVSLLPNYKNDNYKWYEGSPMGGIFIGLLSMLIQVTSLTIILYYLCF